MLVEKYGWAIQKSLFAQTNQDSTFSHTRNNSKMFNIDTNSIPGKIYGNSGMVHFAETNSMLQHIGRVETPKLVPRTCLRYLQTTLIMSGGDWSQNLCEVLSKRKMESKQGFGKTCHLIFLILDIWDMPSSFMTNWVTA